MRFIQLKLENWRGIAQREISFAAGVTVIEGPNEVGKSTIVEAVRMLFDTLDSARGKRLQVIAPVGQDVGSRVELTFAVDDLQITYAKVYNKNRSTQVTVQGSQAIQLAGREAHEWVEQTLAAKVDMALWKALLVDQSDTLASANLQSSQGLAAALDEAAGSRTEEAATQAVNQGAEESHLFAAAAQEYERYFTVKTGKPKGALLALEHQVTQNEQRLSDARSALATVAQDTADQERYAAEVQRLQILLPELQARAQEQDAAWAELDSLQLKRQAKEQEVTAANLLLQGCQQSLDARQRLAQEVQEGERAVTLQQQRALPLQQQVDGLQAQVTANREQVGTARKALEQGRRLLNLASTDAEHFQALATLADLGRKVDRLKELRKQIATALQVTKSSKIDGNVVAQLQEAETALAVATSQRDTAATKLAIVAHKDQSLQVGEQQISISAGELTEHAVSESMNMELVGVASITVTPSASVAEVQDAWNEAQARLAELQHTHQVSSASEAQNVRARRDQAQLELAKLEEEQARLLQGGSLVEFEQEAVALTAQIQGYADQRPSEPELPADTLQAQDRLNKAKQAQAGLEAAAEQQRKLEEDYRNQFDAADLKLRELQRGHEGLAATVAEKKNRIRQDREARSDASLQAEAASQASMVAQLGLALAELKGRWQAANPEALEALRDNAQQVFSRATQDLAQNQRQLDTLNDVLQRAQADGRFEAADTAANLHQQSVRELAAMQTRAAAARLLWLRLTEHRNRARQAYVAPLKQAVESLGAIVFGQGFRVELDDAWTLVSRTLDGKTLPFESLSIGAKEQLGILLRLAAGQVAAKQGGVPLIIDDALGFSDPTKLATMGAAIAAAGRQAQIIILTCTPGRFTQVGSAQVVALT